MSVQTATDVIVCPFRLLLIGAPELAALIHSVDFHHNVVQYIDAHGRINPRVNAIVSKLPDGLSRARR